MFTRSFIFLSILITLNFIQCDTVDKKDPIADEKTEPIKCYVCKSSENVKCTQELTGDEFLTLCGKEDDNGKCYVGIDKDGKTLRRCALKTDDDCKENTEKCKVTEKEKSNSEIFPKDRTKCIKCNGIDNCAKIKDDHSPELCEKNNDKCVVGTDNAKKIFRGCMTENNDNVPSTECSGDACKKEIPTIKCIHCENEKNCKRPEKFENECKLDAKDNEKLCIQQKDKPSCFIRTNSSNLVVRGCASEIDENKNANDFLCDGENCNNKCVNDIHCAQCGGKDEPECIREKESEWYKKKCPDYNVACHSCKLGDKTVKGCGENKDPQSECQYSFKNETFENFKCYRCRSDDPSQEFCSNNKIESDQLEPQRCTHDPSDEEKKCYIDNYDGVVIRGCMSDIVQYSVKKRCNNDNKENLCAICNEDSCNNGKVPNSAAISLLVSFNSISILTIILYLL